MSELLKRVCQVENLPSLPKVAMEVLRLTRDENVSVEALARVIQNDPALAAKLLKVVNSALFGLPRPVASIRQAMVILGLRTVKVMALSFSVVDALSTRSDAELDMELYWKRSLCSAVAGRLLAKVVAPGQSEEAFVAGLLADLGMCALWKCAGKEYCRVFDAFDAGNRPLHEIEREQLGFCHAQASAALLRAWNLPAPVCDAVARHHDESEPPSGVPDLAQIVRAAAFVAEVFCDARGGGAGHLRTRCRQLLGIEEPALEGVLEGLTKFVNETAALLSVRIGRLSSYGELQAHASSQLAALSLRAEVERASAAREAEVVRCENSRLQEEKRAILELASTDALTRVANRAAFDQRLAEEVSRAGASNHFVGLIMLDVDNFKRLNDAHGHPAGDAVLREVAACVQQAAQHATLVARYGGEEFAVIVCENTGRQARELAEQIRRAVESRAVQHDGKCMQVTASLGVAWAQPGRASIRPEQLVEQADQQLYLAKRNGRNRVEMQPDA